MSLNGGNGVITAYLSSWGFENAFEQFVHLKGVDADEFDEDVVVVVEGVSGKRLGKGVVVGTKSLGPGWLDSSRGSMNSGVVVFGLCCVLFCCCGSNPNAGLLDEGLLAEPGVCGKNGFGWSRKSRECLCDVLLMEKCQAGPPPPLRRRPAVKGLDVRETRTMKECVGRKDKRRSVLNGVFKIQTWGLSLWAKPTLIGSSIGRTHLVLLDVWPLQGKLRRSWHSC